MAGDLSYYLLALISLFFLLIKFRDYLSWFVILLFYDGLFAFFGSGIWNLYKSFLPLFAVYVLVRTNSLSKKNVLPFKNLLTLFIVFSVFFFISAIINGDNFTLVLNQYSKFFILILSFFILKKVVNSPNKLNRLIRLLIILLLIQGILTVFKFYLFGVRESIIGTIAYIGGAAGTVLPILGFILVWSLKSGKFDLKDWGLIGLMLLIGIVSMKRAIWFVLPVVVFLFMQYVPGKKFTTKTLFYIPVAILIFYLGIRLNPTLNPDYAYWGRFDAKYAYNYAIDYSFGQRDKEELEGGGRVGGTINLITSLINSDWNLNTFFGFGLKEIFATDTEEFDARKFGINHKGSATGVIQSYISGGIFAITLTIMLILALVNTLHEKRTRLVLIIFVLWEFVLYTGIILRTPSLSFLLVFCIIFLEHTRNNFMYKPHLSYYKIV